MGITNSRSSLEKIVGDYLKLTHPDITFYHNPIFTWCNTYQWSFGSDTSKIIIEVDGSDSFAELTKSSSARRDMEDNEREARQHGYQVIRIPYTAFKDRWQKSLTHHIRNITHIGKPIHIIDNVIYRKLRSSDTYHSCNLL